MTADSQFTVNITQDLMFWDGDGLSSTDAFFQFSAPNFDNQGVTNTSPVSEYIVTADSGRQQGMDWGTYNGATFWEAHGLNFLLDLDAEPGIYSVGVQLISENHLPSDSFAIPFVYDPFESWDPEAEAAGVARVREAVAAFDIADLNRDGHVDTADVDSLVAAIASGSNLPQFDLTGDGAVTDKDLRDWRTKAGSALLPQAAAILPGDANIDGVVDVSDFNLWNANKFLTEPAWSRGDFNADGVVDVSDFNLWNQNKFTASSDGASPSTVPEPSGCEFLTLILLFACPRLRSKLR